MAIDGGLRQLFRKHLPYFHWVSIETGGTGRGIPDSNYCFRGKEGWIEFKQTKGYTVDLRPEQVAWLTRRARAGGRVWVAVRRKCEKGPRRSAADELYIFEGRDAADLKILGLKLEKERILFTGGPANWDWNFAERLLSRNEI